MLELSDPSAQLEVLRAEMAELRRSHAQLEARVSQLSQQNEGLTALGRAALEHILVAEARKKRRKSEQRPLPPVTLPPTISRLLSGELQTLLGLLLPNVQAPGAAPALPPPAAAAGVDEASDDPEPEPERASPAGASGKKATKRHRGEGSGRRGLASELPRETQRLLPPEEELTCPCCGRALREIAVDVTEVLDWIPASYRVRRFERPRFGCTHCKQAGVVQAEAPTLALEGTQAGPGLLAQVLVDKFCDALPLHRQQQRAARQGVSLPRSTLCRWLGALGALVRPLVERAMLPELYATSRLHTDATGLPVMASGSTRLGHLFVYLAEGEVSVFRYAPSHSTAAVRPQLAGYEGTTVCDGATIYDALFEGPEDVGTRAGCWSHARRHFADARGVAPEAAGHALELIGELFEADRSTQHLEGEERTKARAERARPVLDRLQRWMSAQRVEGRKDPLSQAVRYTQRQWERLTRFLTEGATPLTNNAAERALRTVALGRKNWLWVGSDVRGEDAAAFLSLLGTCRTRGIEPWGYLTWLFERLERWPQQRLQELAPRAYQQLQESPPRGPD